MADNFACLLHGCLHVVTALTAGCMTEGAATQCSAASTVSPTALQEEVAHHVASFMLQDLRHAPEASGQKLPWLPHKSDMMCYARIDLAVSLSVAQIGKALYEGVSLAQSLVCQCQKS